jgi:hypothetical protein
MPLVAAEIQRVRTALVAVSTELDAVLAVLRDVDGDGVGTGGCDLAVSAGLSDLATAVHRRQSKADDGVRVTTRHISEPAGGAAP